MLSNHWHHEDLRKSCSLADHFLPQTKYFQVFLSILSLAYSAPAPQEDAAEVAPEVVPYIHEEIEALPYEHDATGGWGRPTLNIFL